jgi:5'-nucleotidase
MKSDRPDKHAHKPRVLVTNDDGIDSPLLRVLVRELSLKCDVCLAAPKNEKSWISKAISRRGGVRVEKSGAFECEAWSIDGTPADCVSIALGQIFKGSSIDCVISGINIGYNVSLPIVMSSGTVAAALEGALFGKPAMALSMHLGRRDFAKLSMDRSELSEELEMRVTLASRHAADFACSLLSRASDNEHPFCVHNINYPKGLTHDTKMVNCQLAHVKSQGVFAPDPEDPSLYNFEFSEGIDVSVIEKTDLNCLNQNNITYTLLDFKNLSGS